MRLFLNITEAIVGLYKTTVFLYVFNKIQFPMYFTYLDNQEICIDIHVFELFFSVLEVLFQLLTILVFNLIIRYFFVLYFFVSLYIFILMFSVFLSTYKVWWGLVYLSSLHIPFTSVNRFLFNEWVINYSTNYCSAITKSSWN